MSEPQTRFFNSVELGLFSSRISAICEEMGALLGRVAFSPNIRDRLDYSCALFNRQGHLLGQATHIPVHLGSMAYAMADVVARMEWHPGDMVILNDPFLGGTHLPDVTLIAPLYRDGELAAFVVNRAHHADIGAEAPGSMPISSRIEEEGLVLEPMHLIRGGRMNSGILETIVENTRNPDDAQGDFTAQISANRAGLGRLGELVAEWGLAGFRRGYKSAADILAVVFCN